MKFLIFILIISLIYFWYIKKEYFISYNDYTLIENDYDTKIQTLDIKEFKDLSFSYKTIQQNIKIEDYEIEQLLDNFFKNKDYNYVKILSSKKTLIQILETNLYLYEIQIIIKQNSISELWNLSFTRKIKDTVFSDISVISFQKEKGNSNKSNIKGYYDNLNNEYHYFRIKNQLGLFEPYKTSLYD
jgi:hypothetical protein